MAARPDEGLVLASQFPRISVHKIPSPTTDVVPPLPTGEGFQCVDFIDENKSPDMKKSAQFLCLLHPGEGG